MYLTLEFICFCSPSKSFRHISLLLSRRVFVHVLIFWYLFYSPIFIHSRSPLVPFPLFMVAPICESCNHFVAVNHRAIQCDICDSWIHIRCNRLDKNDYAHYQHPDNESEEFYCINCISKHVPFSHLNNNEFSVLVKKGITNSTDSYQRMTISK